jgi:signal transduction histidine kinase
MTSRELESRVLVFAPTGRDSPLICNLLSSKGISCVPLPTGDMARFELKLGAGAVVLAEEGLTLPDIAKWAAQISEQPSWSDLPLILLTVAGEVDRKSQRKMLALQPLGNLMLLERPVRPETFVSTVQAALRSRLRQYLTRDFLAAIHASEEALRKSEKLLVAGRLAASISHEINNPLEAVTNLLYLISTSTSLEDAQNHAFVAASELARVSQITTQTLKFYRELGKPAYVQVPEILDSALTQYQARLDRAEINIERDFRECSPILATAGELRQVCLNLIGNALDAMGRGGTLKVRVTNAHEHSNGLRKGIRLSVADTGSGIRPEIRRTLFEPFVGTKGNLGTGLGLWISSEIIRKHGGTIQVKSSTHSPSTGAVFSVFLPLRAIGVIAAPQEKYKLSNMEFSSILSDSKHEEVTLVQAEKIN